MDFTGHCRAVRRAFTVIELLVVLGILTLLAAILFPVFAQAREAARQTQCVSNMRQLGNAARMYLTDHDEMWFPAQIVNRIGPQFSRVQPWLGYDNSDPRELGQGDVSRPATRPARPGAIDPYVHSQRVKECPSMPASWQMAAALNYWYPENYSAYYAINPRALGQEFGPTTRKGMLDLRNNCMVFIGANDSEVEEPARTLLIWEHKAERPVCNFMQRANWFQGSPNNAELRDHYQFLHRDSAVGVWADGHVSRLTYDRLTRSLFTCRKDIYPAN